jgi:hypothetical protein
MNVLDDYERRFMTPEIERVEEGHSEGKKPSRFYRVTKYIGASALVGVALFVGNKLDNAQENAEHKVEVCVSNLVGHKVNLVRDQETGMLQRPAEVMDEMFACSVSDNHPDEAKEYLEARQMPSY